MIHETAIVDPDAYVAVDVVIGPWCEIGPQVEIGKGTQIDSHCVIKGPTRIGDNNHFYSHSVIGEDSQDKKFVGEEARLEIGDRNVVREFCTFNRGTGQGGGLTRIGHDNWIMAYCHVAHDCSVGSNIVMANNATLAGHVTVENHVILGAFTVVHQFCSLGAHSFSALGSIIFKDVPPYLLVAGNTAEPHGLNVEGLRRRGFTGSEIQWLKRAYKVVYRKGLTVESALGELRKIEAECKHVCSFVEFIRKSQRGIVR